MKFIRAIAGLLLACLIGQIFMIWGIQRGDAVQVSFIWIYGFIVVYASPFWLFIFLPLYVWAAPGSLPWKWYVAPPLGMLIGFLAGLMVFGAHFDAADAIERRISLVPAVIGFSLFLFGSISKIRSNGGFLSN